ncbi:hypothetical protein ACRZ5O_08105 [Pseudomonas protegens]|uniref:hypothetical protein n=1 Tax=Pseudomonas protegens TaxID=380021 RepID=UPI00366EA217
MNSRNETNEIKWLLIDQMVDLTSAVAMGREVLRKYRDGIYTLEQVVGRLRVCNHGVILSLFKLNEVRINYSRHLNSLDKDMVQPLYDCAKEIKRRKIDVFRSRHAAHIWDRDDRPISLIEGAALLQEITGSDNSQVDRFYDWVWKDGEPCVVLMIEALIKYLKTVPGGDEPRF